MRKQIKEQQGFTLIELLVVMGIISILAAIIVPRFSGALSKAEEQAHNANLAMLERAVELAYVAGDITGLGSTDTAIDLNELVTKNYLKSLPDCPVDKSKQYAAKAQLNGTNKSLKVTISLEDKP